MGSAASTAAASLDNATVKPRAILVCHSTHERVLRLVITKTLDTATDLDDDLLVVTERFPIDAETRARVLSSSDVAIVAVGPGFQLAGTLVEALSFLKDTRKSLVAGPITFFTRPSGAVGALCLAYGRWDPDLFTLTDNNYHDSLGGVHLLRRSDVGELLATDEQSEVVHASRTDNDGLPPPSKPRLLLLSSSQRPDDAAAQISDKLSTLESQGVAIEGEVVKWGEEEEDSNDEAMLAGAAVVVVIITTKSVSDVTFRRRVEAARRALKPLLPIKERHSGRLEGWLGLVLAGRLWYEVDADDLSGMHTPYAAIPGCPCRVADSCLATDLLVCVNAMLAAPWHQRAVEVGREAREAALIAVAKDKSVLLGLEQTRVDQLCARVVDLVAEGEGEDEDHPSLAVLRDELGVAVSSSSVTKVAEEERAQRASEWPTAQALLPRDQTKTLASYSPVRFTVQRIGFKSLPPVVDADGVAVPGLELDALLSYQWNSQATVLAVQQQGSVASLRAWFDVFGHMQGNVNASMAAAVESVACVVVFVTAAYTASVNCRLEFQYAVARGKPIIFACLEDPSELSLPDWMADVVGGPTLRLTDLYNEDTHGSVLTLDMRDGDQALCSVNAMDVLFGAIRRFAALRSTQQQRINVVCDGSLLLFATTSALKHAVSSEATVDRSCVSGSATCSRCGATFRPGLCSDEDSKLCRRHSAYYLQTSGLLPSHWVCCREPSPDGPGCTPAVHMSGKRQWSCDPTYGTFTWLPDRDD